MNESLRAADYVTQSILELGPVENKATETGGKGFSRNSIYYSR